MGSIQAQVHTLIFGNISGYNTILFQVTYGTVKGRLFATAANADLVTLAGGAVVKDHILPVGTGAKAAGLVKGAAFPAFTAASLRRVAYSVAFSICSFLYTYL
jgi:hypothetical protein